MVILNSILFNKFIIEPGYIECFYEDSLEESGTLKFELSEPVVPRNDLIALSLSTLCGRKYQQIELELSISSRAKVNIERFTNSEVIVKTFEQISHRRKKRTNLTLNFSGGFDSLAALSLMPENTMLVSMDFGGRFSREMKFINTFNAVTCKTNIIDTNFRKNSWTFMGIGSILFSDFLQTDIHTFGSILGASVISNSKKAAMNHNPLPFKGADLENAPYVMPLTEAGTAKIALQSYPELIKDSLNSLANPKEEKRYRKQLLVNAVMKKHDLNIEIENVPEPSTFRFSWGENFQADFITLYLIKNLPDDVQLTVGDIPDEVYSLVNDLSLDFYERVNTNYLANFPIELQGDLLKSLINHGMLTYTENDWIEFNKVRDLFTNYYNIN